MIKGQYTVFAPTNAAFSDLSKDVLDALFSNANKMKSLLSSHIVDGVFFLSDLTKLEELITSDGVVINIKDLGSTSTSIFLNIVFFYSADDNKNLFY